jgi:hypothetical protein
MLRFNSLSTFFYLISFKIKCISFSESYQQQEAIANDTIGNKKNQTRMLFFFVADKKRTEKEKQKYIA